MVGLSNAVRSVGGGGGGERRVGEMAAYLG